MSILPTGPLRDVLHRGALAGERLLERVQARADDGSPPEDFRILAYLGHGTGDEVVVRGRVVDHPEPAEAVVGESTWTAVKRMAVRFESDELPGVPLVVTCGDDRVEVVTDDEGYYDVRLRPGLADDGAPWRAADVRLATTWRGLDPAAHVTTARIRVPEPATDLAFISDVDDTVLQTGAQRLLHMIRITATGSAVTRTPFPGVAGLYRGLETGDGGPRRPFFYVSSSPWNLHGFLTGFLRHRDIPLGPLLLRDLGIDESKFIKSSHGDHKLVRIGEVLDLHPSLQFVLVGDSGQHDPEIYAQVVEQHPGRIRAVWIREVRLDPGDGRVERVAPGFAHAGVPMVLAPDSVAFAEHAVELGLVPAQVAESVGHAVAAERAGASATTSGPARH